MPPDEQVIAVTPHTVCLRRLFAADDFLVVASDGLFNIATNDDISEMVRDRLSSAYTSTFNQRSNSTISDEGSVLTWSAPSPRSDAEIVEDVCHQLTQHALDRRSNDNVTLILLVFPNFIQKLKKEKEVSAAKEREKLLASMDEDKQEDEDITI